MLQISLPAEERRDGEAQYNPFSIDQLEIAYPQIRWMDYFNALMPRDMKLSRSEIVTVVSPLYFERLAKLIEKTPKRIIANYFAWRSFIVSSNFLNDQVRIRKITYLTAISSSDDQHGQGGTTQWKECVTYTAAT